jgi:hypothetical protein
MIGSLLKILDLLGYWDVLIICECPLNTHANFGLQITKNQLWKIIEKIIFNLFRKNKDPTI